MPGEEVYVSGAQMLEDLAITCNGVPSSSVMSSPTGSLSYSHTDTTSESQITSPSRSATTGRNGIHGRADSWVPASAGQVKEPDAVSNGSGQANHFTPQETCYANGHQHTNGGYFPEVVQTAKTNHNTGYAYNAYQLPDNGLTHFSHAHMQPLRTNGQALADAPAPAVQPFHQGIGGRLALADGMPGSS